MPTTIADNQRIRSNIGPFQIRAELGRGGMGIVYRAEDERLGREVAIKILPADRMDPLRRRRFLREARLAASIQHPNVTAVFEVGEYAGDTCLVMEYIAGPTLRALLKQSPGRLPLSESLRITAAIADGLACAHQAGVIHRDLKPENVMLTPGGQVKILDFGLAKLLPPSPADDALATDASSSDLTVEGRVLGTPRYMSPEQVLGQPIDRRSDVFSLGVMLFEMVTGQRPFRGRTAMEVLISIGRDEPDLASLHNPEVTPALDRLLQRCLAKRPADRLAGATTLRAELTEILHCLPDTAAPSPAPFHIARPTSVPSHLPEADVPQAQHQSTLASSEESLGHSLWPLPRDRRESFARGERALSALVLIDLRSHEAESKAVPSTLFAALQREVLRCGGQAEPFVGDLFSATFSAPLISTDLAAQAARLALALRRIVPDRPIVLCMGRSEGHSSPAVSESSQVSGWGGYSQLLRHGQKILARATAVGTAAPTKNPLPITLDKMTAGLLSTRFDVRSEEPGPCLCDELRIPHITRTLLGKRTPYVGRERELSALASLFNECVAEPLGRAVLVIAPPVSASRGWHKS